MRSLTLKPAQSNSILAPLPSLLPPSQNPSLSLISLISSRLAADRCRPSTSHPPLDPIRERHLIPFLGPTEITRILLLSLSRPLPSLSFLLWSLSPPVSLTPAPLHFSIVSLSLSFSRCFSHSLSLFSLFLTTHPDTDYLNSLLSASKFCNWDPSVFSLLIKSLVRKKRLEEALDTCRRVIGLSWSPDVNTFNSLLNPLVKLGSFEKCWDLYHQMRQIGVSPNFYTCNILIHALCKAGNMAEVENFLYKIENEDGFCADLVSYNTILQGFCNKRMLNDAFHLFDVMPLRGIVPNLISYTILIDALCKDERLKDAHRLFVKMHSSGIKPDGFVYKVLINGYYNDAKMRNVKLLLEEMIATDLLIDNSTCEFVIKTYLKIGKLISCINLVALSRKNGICVSYNSYFCVIEALCTEKRPNAAKGLLEWILHDGYLPNLEIYNLIINSFCEFDCIKDALQLMVEMESREVKPNLDTCRILIGCLCRLGKSIQAELLLQEMVKYGINPDGDICAKLVQGFIKEKDLNKAEFILRHFVKQFEVHDNLGYNALMKVYCEEEEISMAFELQDRMMQIGFVSSKDTCRSIIYGLCKNSA